MIRHLQLAAAEWGRFGIIPDPPNHGHDDRSAAIEFDDWRRRLTQETATLHRIERLRWCNFARRMKGEM